MITTRYLSREVFHTMLALIGILLLIVISDMFVRFLSNAAEGSLSSNIIFILLGLALPQYLAILLPICFFLAIILAFGRMFSDNELMILFACGVSWQRIMRMMIMPAAIIVVLVAVLSLYLVPEMTAYQYSLKKNANRKETISLIQPGRFVSFNNGDRVLYIGKVDQNKGYQDIFGFSVGKPKQAPSIITAPSAYLNSDQQKNVQTVVMEDGYQYTGYPDQADYRVIHFHRYSTKLLPKQTVLDRQRINTMSTWQLIAQGGTQQNVELQWRFTFPLAVVVLLLLGLYLCRVRPRQGRYGRVLPSVLVFIIYFNAVSAMRSWMINNDITTWYLNLWLVHLAFIVLSIFLLWRADGYSWFRYRHLRIS